MNDVISLHHLLQPDGTGTGDIAHLVRRLPSSSIPGRRTGMDYVLIMPALGRWKQEDQKIKVFFGYEVSSKTAWDTRNPG